MKRYHKQTLSTTSCSAGNLTMETKENNNIIATLENDKIQLEEEVEALQLSVPTPFKKDGKMFSTDIRMFIYDCIINQVPTRNTPQLLAKFAPRTGVELNDIPHRTTVEIMTRELGLICNLQAAEVLSANGNCTLGFDATTQEGVHINEIHITTKMECHVIALVELPCGTAEDYVLHIVDSVDRLADVYSTFHNVDYQESRKKLISNITNTLTDCMAVNHAAIGKVSDIWGKSLNELNCHLHPLDTIATATKIL